MRQKFAHGRSVHIMLLLIDGSQLDLQSICAQMDDVLLHASHGLGWHGCHADLAMASAKHTPTQTDMQL